MSMATWTISQLVGIIHETLREDFRLQNVWAAGEIGRFTAHPSGHWYFTLKDESATIEAVMFRSANRSAGFLPKTGDSVLVGGHIDVFEQGGRMQLVVTAIRPARQGDLHARLEKIRNRLAGLGYFDETHKRQIPPYPTIVGVITGQATAALQDVRVTIANRWPLARLAECYAVVQGDTAPASIIAAFAKAVSLGCDVIILARGGGSMEDLWCFNDEALAKVIYDCPIPVITGIGHEIDFTIAESVADVRCATPTAAAQRAVPDRGQVAQLIGQRRDEMVQALTGRLDEVRQKMDYMNSRLANSGSLAQKQRLAWMKVNGSMVLAMTLLVEQQRHRLRSQRQVMAGQASVIPASYRQRLVNTCAVLDSLSPLKIIDRGYVITSQQGRIIKKVSETDMTADIDIRYADGTLKAAPLERHENGEQGNDI